VGETPAAAEIDDRVLLQRRINSLQQKMAALYSEVLELRRKLRRFEQIEAHFAQTGGASFHEPARCHR
jgi:hypothetical protein